MSGSIFINYRRDDASGFAGRIYDRLALNFDSNRIFMDVDNIEPGLDFVDILSTQVASCDVLIAIIGRHWTTSVDKRGSRRLADTRDFVRIEIEAALERNIVVIPVLVDGAQMPELEELPQSLQPLGRRHAVEISHAHFRSDTDRLVKVLERRLTEIAARSNSNHEAKTQVSSDIEQNGLEAEPEHRDDISSAEAKGSSEKISGIKTIPSPDDIQSAEADGVVETEDTVLSGSPDGTENAQPWALRNRKVAMVFGSIAAISLLAVSAVVFLRNEKVEDVHPSPLAAKLSSDKAQMRPARQIETQMMPSPYGALQTFEGKASDVPVKTAKVSRTEPSADLTDPTDTEKMFGAGFANAKKVKVIAIAPERSIKALPTQRLRFAIQLAAPGTQEDAEAASSRLEQKFSAQLKGHALSIQKAGYDGRVVFRVRGIDLTKDQATSICEDIKAAGGSCFVAYN